MLQARIAKGEKLEGLLGKTGIANLKLTYQKFKEIFLGEGFAAIKAAGGAVQRPLWALTLTKNPQYPDLMYVETVVGPDTVNTMPPQTIDALLDHGKIVADTVESDLDGVRDVMRALQDAKISLFEVTENLQVEGLTLFSDSFAALLGAIVYKQKLLEADGAERVRLTLGSSQTHYESALNALASADFLNRLWAHDATLWSNDPNDAEIIKKSLGWLTIQQHMLESVPELRAFGDEIKERFDFVVVCGMGGSSLAPDILADTLASTTDGPNCSCSIRPVRRKSKSSKNGSRFLKPFSSSRVRAGRPPNPTPSTRTFTRRSPNCWAPRSRAGTLPRSPTPAPRCKRKPRSAVFSTCFENDPNIGGRYSALSYVGVAPSAMVGYDINLLLDRALGAMHANDRTVSTSKPLRERVLARSSAGSRLRVATSSRS